MHRFMRGLVVPTLVSGLLLGNAAAVSARPQILEPEVDAGGARTAIHLRILDRCRARPSTASS